VPPAEWPDGHRAGRWPAPLGRRVSALLLASRSFVIRMLPPAKLAELNKALRSHPAIRDKLLHGGSEPAPSTP
jgi:hypothetical protein